MLYFNGREAEYLHHLVHVSCGRQMLYDEECRRLSACRERDWQAWAAPTNDYRIAAVYDERSHLGASRDVVAHAWWRLGNNLSQHSRRRKRTRLLHGVM